MTFLNKFAKFLCEKRRAMGLSQQQLAEITFGDKKYDGYISDIETGKRTGLTAKTIDKLLKALESDIEFIEK
jgi:transcriptional regulator with XRE-family HTH domain